MEEIQGVEGQPRLARRLGDGGELGLSQGSNVCGQELPVYFKSLLLVIRTPLS